MSFYVTKKILQKFLNKPTHI